MARTHALVVTVLLLAVVPTAHRAEGAPDAPDLGALAQAILRGADDVAAQAAVRAKELPPEASQRLVQELAGQARVYRALDAQQIRGLVWENVGLQDALFYVHTLTALSAAVTPRAAAEKEPEVKYSFRLDASNASTLLDLMTEPYGLAWGVREGVIRVFVRQDFPVTDAHAPSTLRARLAGARVTLTKEGPLTEVVASLRPVAGVDLVIDPRVQPELSPRRVSVRWDAKPLREALDALVAALGDGVTWTVWGDVVLLTLTEFVAR